MAETFIVTAHGRSWLFNRVSFKKQFEDSMISKALDLDRSATQIDIQCKDVTVEVMDIVWSISEQRIIPPIDHSIQETLVKAGGYLNMDILLLISTKKYSEFVREFKEVNLLDQGSIQNYAEKIIYYVIRNDYVEMLDYLIKNGVDPSAHNNKYIQLASMFGYASIVDRLLQDDRVDPTVSDGICIQNASERGHTDVVRRLLKDTRVNPFARQNTPILLASTNGHADIVHLLMQDERVDPSHNGNKCIIEASSKGHLEVINRLLEDKRVDPSVEGNQCLRRACKSGKRALEVVERLLQDPRVDPSNIMVLCGACLSEDISIVRRILQDPRVDPSTQDGVVFMFVKEGCTEITDLLMQDPRVQEVAEARKLWCEIQDM